MYDVTLPTTKKPFNTGTQVSTATMQIRRVKPQLHEDDVSDTEGYASSDSNVPQFEDQDEDMNDAGSVLEAAAESESEEEEEEVRSLHNVYHTIAEGQCRRALTQQYRKYLSPHLQKLKRFSQRTDGIPIPRRSQNCSSAKPPQSSTRQHPGHRVKRKQRLHGPPRMHRKKSPPSVR
jgi:hypothetical protein